MSEGEPGGKRERESVCGRGNEAEYAIGGVERVRRVHY